MEARSTEFRRVLLRLITLPVLLAVMVAGVSLWQVHTLLSVTGWVEHTDQVLARAHAVQTLLMDQETGLRGYLVTGTPRFLEPFERAQPQTIPAMTALRRLVADNPAQGWRMGRVEDGYQEWLAHALSMRQRRRSQGDYDDLELNTRGKDLMDGLRGEMHQFIQTEEQLRERRTRRVNQATRQAIAAGVFVSLLLGALLVLVVRGQLLRLSQTYEGALVEAEASAERLRREQQVTDTALTHLRLPELLRELLQRVATLLHADTGAVLLLEPEGTRLRIYEILGVDSPARREFLLPLGQGFAGRVAAERRPITLKNLTERDVISPFLRGQGVNSLLGVPLLVEERLIGVLHVGSYQPRDFTPEEIHLLQVVADRIALAIENARMFARIEGQADELERQILERTAQLEESNAELQSFAYSVSHDLRAPLRAIHGFSDALAEDYCERLDAEGQEYLAALSASADRMDRLIEDLLAYSRLSRSELSPHPVPLELAVEEALVLLPAEVRSHVTVEKPLPCVLGHRPTLVQVLLNLLSNAAKFVPPGVTPNISLRSEPRGDWTRVWVEDNGIGIAAEHQERIFRVFERLHGVEAYPGTGIGLAIVRRGMERMSGRSGVESVVGEGSCFWIELPRESAT